MSQLRYELSGSVFGKWRVLHRDKKGKNNKQYWMCICECGHKKAVEGHNLRSGRSRSCRRCSSKQTAIHRFKTHGMTNTVVFRRWQAMKTRCTNPNARSWKYHGGSGVRVCDEWLDSFEAFYECLGDPPTPRHTLDRIDAFGNYEPGNVRWATPHEQMSNTRRAARYTARPISHSQHTPET